jgi:hypothetical protein
MATEKAPGNIPQDKLDAYKRLVDTNPKIEIIVRTTMPAEGN